MMEHWFWLLLTAACVIWYSTITVFVAVRGMKDIRGMLERLAKKSAATTEDGSDGG
jgi:hypothetical protein